MNQYSEAETSAIAADILASLTPSETGATVLALQGDLGAGKTTLTKAIAAALGVSDTVVSPTFVITKFYQTTHDTFNTLAHMDAYRIETLDELGPLGWQQLLQQPNTLVIVEWPEKIQGALPEHAQRYVIEHTGDTRIITRQ